MMIMMMNMMTMTTFRFISDHGPGHHRDGDQNNSLRHKKLSGIVRRKNDDNCRAANNSNNV